MNTAPALDAGVSMNVDAGQIYTDLNSVQQLKAQSKVDKTAALKNIAHQFEAMMVQMMMKSMRDADKVFADGDMTSSSDGKFYQDMFDNQLSLSLSKGRGFGIAEALMRQLQGRFGNENKTSEQSDGVDKNLDAVQRVQTLVEQAASTNGGAAAISPRVTAAIQDALHQLFGGAGDETSASSSAVSLDGTPQNFVESLRPLAQRVSASLGVDSDVLLSQSALETGWGQKVLQCPDGSSSFNFFNIKADDSWTGAVVKVPTVEYQNGVAVREWASFRAYSSPEESFADYARLVSENPRYQQALQCADNPRAYIKALAQAGYATDPNYASKVISLYDGEHMRGSTDTTASVSPNGLVR
jgi:flagellar protein FlgJ